MGDDGISLELGMPSKATLPFKYHQHSKGTIT
jgi:hypothetical protein